MKKQIVASSTKRSYVRAASTEKMLNAFEDKLEELQGEGIESSTEVTSSVHLTDEQRDILWDVIDQYNTSHPVSGNWADETAHEQHTIADTFGISLADARQIMIDELGFDPNLEGHMEGDHWAEDFNAATDVESASKVACTDDFNPWTDHEANHIQIYHDDYYSTYEDTNGIFSGVPGSDVSLAEMKSYWNTFYDEDDTLNEEYGPEEGKRWLADTLSHMKSLIEESTQVTAAKNDYQPFMLMEYSSGGPETGIEGDDFYCWGKFFAKDEADAKRQLERAKRKFKDWNFADVYVSEYNDYFDDGYEVYDSLDTLIQRSIDAHKGFEEYDENGELIFNSEDATPEDIPDEVLHDDPDALAEPVEGGSLGDFYFGKEQAEKYGDLICEHLKGKTVSKRKDLAEEPGGLIYEANLLGIDMWDLLEALEGLCYQGRAMEIDDSTYKVK